VLTNTNRAGDSLATLQRPVGPPFSQRTAFRAFESFRIALAAFRLQAGDLQPFGNLIEELARHHSQAVRVCMETVFCSALPIPECGIPSQTTHFPFPF
jgi:hypothetical protein